MRISTALDGKRSVDEIIVVMYVPIVVPIAPHRVWI